MRLSVSKSKNSTSLYVIQSIYDKGKRTTRVVEKLGTVAELQQKLNGQDPIEWAKSYIEELNKREEEQSREVIVRYSPSKVIPKDQQHSFNGGYLFLQQIYHELDLHKICAEISRKHKFTFDLNAILSRLLYGRILFPSSKLATYQHSSKFIEQPGFELQHVYRALEVISKDMDFIQSSLYSNSLKASKRNTGILYYDCTNYFFEIEQEDGLKQYGASKEHRPSPIIQMGLFMDGDGIPLAFNLSSGNTNEQITLKPLEEKILSEEAYDGFYAVCTNLEGSVQEIIRINQRRWEIEECFRIMKSEFKARPVYLSRDDRIKAHFTTCFMSLIIYRLLEKKLENKFTCSEIINGLKDMNFYEIKGQGYIPTYTRTSFTDALHETFGFRTDYEIIKKAQMKKLFKATKK